MYKAVLFDMDGLVIDTEKHYKKAWIQAANELGFKMTAREHLYLRSCSKKYAEPLMQKFFGSDFDYDKVRNRRKEIMEEDLQKFGIEKKHYADEILDFLKANGIKSALVTATQEEKAREYFKNVDEYLASFLEKDEELKKDYNTVKELINSNIYFN